MKKGKILCSIIALMLVLTAFAPVTAHASPNYSFSFSYSDEDEHYESWHEKGDTEQLWVVTLYDTTSSNLSFYNILALKMQRSSGDEVDRWHTFSNYVERYGVDYFESVTVTSTDMMRLCKKRMINGTTETNLYVTGLYNP